ncbi:hypothetical protein GLAREA_11791 [Glarea lozoyensis ATCC 20868]|uniref:Uncharacterized protein n=1 Tax=Glarea lozoyensis (strain ATCC 20868 / MF5171) TaxID=1116229 RepID=S3CH66_GLAL2|nr:uncharacterized protein GLAREA_11791 [Glarea lozoyensis ATCC 20868]EPE25210.1 hypothetical protein GLAREA_11791 [Glarea lozoyensis ATCC 20868]
MLINFKATAPILVLLLASCTNAILHCKPLDDPDLCMLSWETNTGGPASSQLEKVPAYSKATIYSPTCVPWGSSSNEPRHSNEVIPLWGSSSEEPLKLSTKFVTTPGNWGSWESPVWEYGGERYGYSSCACVEAEKFLECWCPFRCKAS